MTLKLDHIIIAVDDLNKATEDYKAAGFNAFYGGEHANGTTHNALVCFADGSYLELIARTDKEPRDELIADFRTWFDRGTGLIGYALISDDLDGDLAGIRERELPVSDVRAGGRVREDGIALAWRTAGFADRRFPFVIQDVTDRNLRVPDSPEVTTHTNGANAVIGMELRVPYLKAAVTFYQDLLGTEPTTVANRKQFMIGDTLKLTLRESGDLEPSDHEAPARLILRTTKVERVGTLDMSLTHGAEIELHAAKEPSS